MININSMITNSEEHLNDHVECSICLTDDYSENFTTLPCNHTFHTECIEEWISTSCVEVPGDILDQVNQIQWKCPLCRFVMYEDQDEIQDAILTLSIVKFRSTRCYIKTFTSIDIIFAILTIFNTSNPLYLLWICCSIYGYNGANNFNIDHLRIYACFCIFPLAFRTLNVIETLEYMSSKHMTLTHISHSVFIHLCFSLLSVLFQLYLMSCVYYLSSRISLYEQRLQRFVSLA